MPLAAHKYALTMLFLILGHPRVFIAESEIQAFAHLFNVTESLNQFKSTHLSSLIYRLRVVFFTSGLHQNPLVSLSIKKPTSHVPDKMYGQKLEWGRHHKRSRFLRMYLNRLVTDVKLADVTFTYLAYAAWEPFHFNSLLTHRPSPSPPRRPPLPQPVTVT
ncbi:hypothetical protein CEXT_531391 [Caerostris extrusa]|uniref:Secreted protein n=1 Tax=Caerostris extrusa TaxID=172846 RepID=A0AAV4Y3F8_CAEEX|nr:hypothetical protein CEXT_531391 [Caerostris extrusa]